MKIDVNPRKPDESQLALVSTECAVDEERLTRLVKDGLARPARYGENQKLLSVTIELSRIKDLAHSS